MSILQLRRYQPRDADLTAVAASGIAKAWTPYTPTVTAGSGTFTTASATGRYLAMGKLVFVQVVVTITTNGTAAGGVRATLPGLGNAAALYIISGRANALTGKMLQGVISAAGTSVNMINYDNTYPGASGEILTASGVYEVA